MISRTYLTRGGNLELLQTPAPDASHSLETSGFAMVEGVLTAEEIDELSRELHLIFETMPPDV